MLHGFYGENKRMHRSNFAPQQGSYGIVAITGKYQIV